MFLRNTHNKSYFSSTFHKHHITVKQYDSDADTSIVGGIIATASDCFTIASLKLITFVSLFFFINYYMEPREEIRQFEK